MISEWTALIIAIGGICGAILFRAKEIYEVWVKFTEGWRKDKNTSDGVLITELKEHIGRLKREGDNLNSKVTFLNHEQIECAIEEERLWGALVLLHHHLVEQNQSIQDLGGHPPPTPKLPDRRKRNRMDPDEFLRRTAELNQRLQSVSPTIASINPSSQSTIQTNATANTPSDPPPTGDKT